MLDAGTVAPDFAVGNETLYGLLAKGRAIVYFFPKAFTPGCTRESIAFGTEFERLAGAGCAVVGVSTDEQAKSDAFRKSLSLPFPLVGDPDGTISRTYGVRWPLLGVARRVTYVIGQDRRVTHVHHSEWRAESHVGEACEVVLKNTKA
jgi:peroxiredoxin Q/BCP